MEREKVEGSKEEEGWGAKEGARSNPSCEDEMQDRDDGRADAESADTAEPRSGSSSSGAALSCLKAGSAQAADAARTQVCTQARRLASWRDDMPALAGD